MIGVRLHHKPVLYRPTYTPLFGMRDALIIDAIAGSALNLDKPHKAIFDTDDIDLSVWRVIVLVQNRPAQATQLLGRLGFKVLANFCIGQRDLLLLFVGADLFEARLLSTKLTLIVELGATYLVTYFYFNFID